MKSPCLTFYNKVTQDEIIVNKDQDLVTIEL